MRISEDEADRIADIWGFDDPDNPLFNSNKEPEKIDEPISKTNTEKANEPLDQKSQKQLGNISYEELKKNGDLQYRNISEKMFNQISKTIAVSGFMQKDGSINIAFSKRELDKYKQIEQDFKKKVEKNKKPKTRTPKKSKGLDR